MDTTWALTGFNLKMTGKLETDLSLKCFHIKVSLTTNIYTTHTTVTRTMIFKKECGILLSKQKPMVVSYFADSTNKFHLSAILKSQVCFVPNNSKRSLKLHRHSK